MVDVPVKDEPIDKARKAFEKLKDRLERIEELHNLEIVRLDARISGLDLLVRKHQRWLSEGLIVVPKEPRRA